MNWECKDYRKTVYFRDLKSKEKQAKEALQKRQGDQEGTSKNNTASSENSKVVESGNVDGGNSAQKNTVDISQNSNHWPQRIPQSHRPFSAKLICVW